MSCTICPLVIVEWTRNITPRSLECKSSSWLLKKKINNSFNLSNLQVNTSVGVAFWFLHWNFAHLITLLIIYACMLDVDVIWFSRAAIVCVAHREPYIHLQNSIVNEHFWCPWYEQWPVKLHLCTLNKLLSLGYLHAVYYWQERDILILCKLACSLLWTQMAQ